MVASSAGSAQTKLPDVVVTAERVETTLRKTSTSAVVVGEDDIQLQGLTQLSDLTGRVAGVVVPNGFSNQPQAVAIRGVGASQPAMSQAVGIYLDDVPLVRGYGTALWDLPDLARIEVLRGPQGTLHGQNSTAGAVKLISLDPSMESQAWGSILVGNRESVALRGYATGQLGDGPLAGSIAFSRRHNGGYGYNVPKDERINQLDTLQARAKLAWKDASGSSVVLAIDGLRDRSDTNTQNYPLNHPSTTPRHSFTTVPNGDFERDAGGVSLTGNWQVGQGMTLRSITAWRGFVDDPVVVDIGGLETQRFGLRQRVTQRAWSQEFQLRGHAGIGTWTLGAIAQQDEFDFRRYTVLFPLAAPAPSYTEAWSKLKTTDLGAYGQLRVPLGERSALTAGLRAWRTSQDGSNEFWRTDASGNRLANVYEAPDLDTSDDGLVPRVVIEAQPQPDWLTYASLAQGAKFGGFNRAAESERSATFPTQPERVTTLELGSKSRHASGSVGINAALFYNRYRDLLASVSNAVIDGVLVPEPVLMNAGRAHTWGLDVELAAQLGRSTQLELSVEVLRSKVDEFTATGTSQVVAGNELPNAPTASAGLTLRQERPFIGDAIYEWSATVRHIRPYFTDLANTPALATPKQTLVDAGVALRDASRQWTATLTVQNLFGKDLPLLRTRIPPLGVDSVYWNAPRVVTLSIRRDL